MSRARLLLAGSVGVVLAIACSGPANLGQTDGGTLGSSGSGGSGSGGSGSGGSGSGGSGSGGSGSGGHAEEDAGTACTGFAAAKCAKFDACTQNNYVLVHYGDQATCIAREAIACLGVLEAPGNTASVAGFEQCGEDITNGSCSDFFDLTNTTKACTPPVGPFANGAGCVNNGQCQSTWCYAATTAACGVCATRPAAGAPCVASVDCGGNGMLCSTAGTCAPVVALGGACDTANPCGFGLSCVGTTITTSGTCQTAGTAVGTACDDNRQNAPLCEDDDGYYCPSATDQCALATLVVAGQACGVYPGDAGAPPPVDAGSPDSGPPDAGPHDAGAPDAGHDAGAPDAGLDAGLDAGPVDAGVLDATTDATLTDAASTDDAASSDDASSADDATLEDGGSAGIDADLVHPFAGVPSVVARCTAGAACEPSTAEKGTCVAAAADGNACDTVNGPPCLAPARCVISDDASTTGVCAILELTTCH